MNIFTPFVLVLVIIGSLLSSTAANSNIVKCDGQCSEDLLISCDDLLDQYTLQGSCCSLSKISAYDGCRVQVGFGNCYWYPKCEECPLQTEAQWRGIKCGVEFRGAESSVCPASEYPTNWKNSPVEGPWNDSSCSPSKAPTPTSSQCSLCPGGSSAIGSPNAVLVPGTTDATCGEKEALAAAAAADVTCSDVVNGINAGIDFSAFCCDDVQPNFNACPLCEGVSIDVNQEFPPAFSGSITTCGQAKTLTQYISANDAACPNILTIGTDTCCPPTTMAPTKITTGTRPPTLFPTPRPTTIPTPRPTTIPTPDNDEFIEILSSQCFNETIAINDDASFQLASSAMTNSVVSLDHAPFCQVDTSTSRQVQVTNVFCNVFYKEDVPNTIEEECTKLGGTYEEVGIFFDCYLSANNQTGAAAANLYSTHHDVPTCMGTSCTRAELATYSQQHFQPLEAVYGSYSCQISYYGESTLAPSAFPPRGRGTTSPTASPTVADGSPPSYCKLGFLLSSVIAIGIVGLL